MECRSSPSCRLDEDQMKMALRVIKQILSTFSNPYFTTTGIEFQTTKPLDIVARLEFERRGIKIINVSPNSFVEDIVTAEINPEMLAEPKIHNFPDL
ncbi:MAG: hypothetical protein MPJ06_04000 [Nitrosopumilus sp.]|nr:hypothetical protein [Nitrosopumilus sp.]